MVQGGVLLLAMVFSLVNLLVDIIYAYADPRIKSQYSRSKGVRPELACGILRGRGRKTCPNFTLRP